MEIDRLKDKKVAIIGLGIEGLALAQFLLENKINFTVLDKFNEDQLLGRLEGDERKRAEKIVVNEKIDKVLGEDYLDALTQFDIVFRSPGISFFNDKIQTAFKHGVEISSQIKLFFELCPCKIVGVTGTKGKGTTSSLIYEILKEEFKSEQKRDVYIAGNIGYPAITLLEKIKLEDIVILELSSFQLMDLDRSPEIAVVVNLEVDHLDYHKDISEYRNAKKSILRFQKEGDLAILNKRSSFEDEFVKSVKSKVEYFSSIDRSSDAVVEEIEGEKVVVLNQPGGEKREVCKQREIRLFGDHNLENIAAAALVADNLGVNIDVVRKVTKDFVGLPHRIELIKEIDGVKYINDSFATNPEPTMAAIKSFKSDKILILGGSSKGADFTELAEAITSSNTKAVILIGVEGKKIGDALAACDYKGEIIFGGDNIDSIVEKAKLVSQYGDVVLFSPACASFDMFKNYKDRGDKFKNAVLALV